MDSALSLYNNQNITVVVNRQISLVNKLLSESNREKLIKFLLKNDFFALQLISQHAALDPDTINEYSDDLNWGYRGISNNQNITWDRALIEKFTDLIDWTSLSWYIKNPTEILTFPELKSDGFSLNENFNWTTEFIKSHTERLDFRFIVANPRLPWSFIFIEEFKDKWIWTENDNGYFLFTISKNPGLPWSEELIDKYYDKWDWEELSANKGIPWSITILEKYKTKLRWGSSGLSNNPSLPWSISLIEKYNDKWNWGALGISGNEGLNWSIQLLRRYKDNWDHYGLSRNNAIKWNSEMISEVKSWGYHLISPYSSKNAPWSLEYLESNYDNLDFNKIFKYDNLWETTFKPFLDDKSIRTILQTLRSRINYRTFLQHENHEEDFEDFLFSRGPFWWNVVTDIEITELKQFFTTKYKTYRYVNSFELYEDLLNEKLSLQELETLSQKPVPITISDILIRRVDSPARQFVFKQEHKAILFLTNNIKIPTYILQQSLVRQRQPQANKLLGWLKKNFKKV